MDTYQRNFMVWGFGYPKFTRTVGASEITAVSKQWKAYLYLKPIGREDENDIKILQNRLFGFRGYIVTIHDNYSTTTRDEMIKLFQMINDTVQQEGYSANRYISIIPESEEDSAIYGEATNQPYNCCLSLDQDIKFSNLTDKIEDVETCSLVWVIPQVITELPYGLTWLGMEYMEGDDEIILTGDDDEQLQGG